MTEPVESRRLGYRPELDGVRGIAVLAIFGYHVAFIEPSLHKFFQGGFLSVDVFFVLSGMLITEILINDHQRRGSADLRLFYRRRARRLLPCLVTFVATTVAYYSLVHHRFHVIVKGYWAVVVFVTSGHTIANFPPGVSQVWTLVVEWEFYFLWPLLLVFLLRRGLSLRTIAYVAIALTLAAAITRAVLFHANGDTQLSYFNAGLRFEDLLCGCAIGLLGTQPQVPGWIKTLGVGFLIVVTSRAAITQAWVYYVGMLLAAVVTASIVQPRARSWWFDKVLASKPAVWVGTISYSFYLWSVFSCSEVGHELSSWPRFAQFLIATALSFGLASASYYLIEQRFRLTSSRTAPTPAVEVVM